MKIFLNDLEYKVIFDLLNMSKEDYEKNIGNDYLDFNNLHNYIFLSKKNNEFFMKATRDNFLLLREVLGNYLMVADSFDEDYNATLVGNAIEDLIDKTFLE